jgi:hypothetical protein
MPLVIMLKNLPLFMIVVKPDASGHRFRLDTSQYLEEIRQTVYRLSRVHPCVILSDRPIGTDSRCKVLQLAFAWCHVFSCNRCSLQPQL